MSYLIGAVSYDNPRVDRMPISRTRGDSFVRPGINGFGVVHTGAGGQPFMLVIETYFTTWALAVTYGNLVQSLQKTFATITTPKGTFVNCYIDQVASPDILYGIPNTRVRAQLRGRVP